MIYVFDTSSFRVISNFYPKTFRSFWLNFNECVYSGSVISVREVSNELEVQNTKEHLLDWMKEFGNIFLTPNSDETDFVREIFSLSKFQMLVKPKDRLLGKPLADPFLIAAAKIRNGCVVTEESSKENSAHIPVICKHFGIQCINVEGFLEQNGWEW